MFVVIDFERLQDSRFSVGSTGVKSRTALLPCESRDGPSTLMAAFQPACFPIRFSNSQFHHREPRRRVPDAVQRTSRGTAEPGPTGAPRGAWAPDQQRTTPKSGVLRSIRGTQTHLRLPAARCVRVVQSIRPIGGRGATPRGERALPQEGSGECRVPVAPAAARVE